MFDLTGRTALVTGAGRGVGAGIARLLAANGARVGVNDISGGRARETVKDITLAGGLAIAAPFDVIDYVAVCTGIQRLEDELGRIDILVNNAGTPGGMATRLFRESQPGDWRPYVDLNLYGVLNCCRATLNGMVERGFGRSSRFHRAQARPASPLESRPMPQAREAPSPSCATSHLKTQCSASRQTRSQWDS